MTDRRALNMETKLASALLALGDIPYLDAKAMGAGNLISLYQFDHGIRHAEGGTADFWNLTPTLIIPHRIKSATVDAPEMARNRSIQDSEAIRLAKRASRAGDYAGAAVLLSTVKKKSRLKPKRPWPKRKMQSRGFEKMRAAQS